MLQCFLVYAKIALTEFLTYPIFQNYFFKSGEFALIKNIFSTSAKWSFTSSATFVHLSLFLSLSYTDKFN